MQPTTATIHTFSAVRNTSNPRSISLSHPVRLGGGTLAAESAISRRTSVTDWADFSPKPEA